MAEDHRLTRIAPDGSRTSGPDLFVDHPDDRWNDGVCDAAGRFLVGTASIPGARHSQRLLRTDGDTTTVLDDDLGLANGMAFSPDDSLLYTIDSVPGRQVWVRDYDQSTGAVGTRRPTLQLTDAVPDGLCLDATGNLWLAAWSQGQVRCYSPAGELLDVIELPAPHTTSLAFVGPELDQLLITTARGELSTCRAGGVPLVGQPVPRPSRLHRPGHPSLVRTPHPAGDPVKLMRLGPVGAERPVVRIDDTTYVDVSDAVTDYDEAFFGSGGLDRVRMLVAERTASGRVHSFAGARIGAPIARPHQILCIGLNYSDHAAETGQAVPDEPILFTKSPNTIVGPYDDVRIPRGSTKTDWEVELGIVIGRRTSYLDSVDEARDAIAGFVLVNDVSERAFQLERSGQWSKGKSAETFNPTGPWLVTPDEIDDVLALGMRLDVNGVSRQRGSTATMIFDPYFIVHHLSQFLVLEPGDLIDTGTPPGVGMGHDPQVWLAPGDVMELGIDGLGTQRQTVIAPR